jgi:uncharacterized membrane protein YqjE
MDDVREPTLAVGDEARQRHLDDDLRALLNDGMAYASAEAELQKARAGYALGRIKGIALLGALALALVFFALVALTVGLVIALTPPLTAWGATAAVFGGLLVVAALCALLAARRWKSMTAALANPEAE